MGMFDTVKNHVMNELRIAPEFHDRFDIRLWKYRGIERLFFIHQNTKAYQYEHVYSYNTETHEVTKITAGDSSVPTHWIRS